MDSIEKNIIKRNRLSDDEINTLSFFVSMMYVRGLYMRKQIQKMEQHLAKKMMKMSASREDFIKDSKKILKDEYDNKLTDEQAIKMQKIFQNEKYEVDFGNAVHLEFMTEEMDRFANLFYRKKWRFYYNNSENSFITSDTPLVEWFPKRNNFYGPTIYERKHYFALPPRVLIELINPLDPGKHIKRKMISGERMDYYNSIIANYSNNFCYSIDKKSLQKLIDIRDFVLESEWNYLKRMSN